MNTKHTFLSLCNAYDKIEIPIIQRDYAQGRDTVDAAEIRTKFIDDYLIDQLILDQPMELDFVYGSVIEEKKGDDVERTFIPLDGQQRLTTLFLLHYFIAIKEGELDKVQHFLSKFTYETRPSAKDFCQNLLYNFQITNISKIKFEITNSNWFSEDWYDDPTISGMLTILNSFANNDKLLKSNNKFLLKLLDIDKQLISFYFTDLDEFGLTENLYIRMNARGKMLSKFENFKSEFFKIISYDSILTAQVKDKIEYKWVENLWHYKKKDSFIIDEPFMSFLAFISQMLYFKDAEFRSTKGYVSNFLNFKVLESIYTKKENLEFLIFSLDNISEIRKLQSPIHWNKNSISDILTEVINGTPETIDFFMLYASFRYLQAKKDNANLCDYIRVIRNLTQNTVDKSVREWPHILKTITDLITDENIYEYIVKSDENSMFRGFYSEQIKEEKYKAYLITNFPKYKNDIQKYEDNNNLKGKIIHLLKSPICNKIKEYEELNLYALPYDVKSFKKLQNIYIAYDEISKDDFVNIWGDLLNTPIYYHDKYYHRIDVASIYWNCPSIFFFSRKFSEHTLSENLTGFLDTIRKEFVSSMLKKYSTLEEVRNPKNQLYLYYILHRNINEKSIQSFFKNRNYNFGWLKKEKGYKSLFTKGVEDSIEFEDQNPIFQVYNAQFRYSFGINSKNTLDLEKLGIGNKRNPFEELVKWSNF